MRIARIALVGALLLGAAACQTDDGSAVATNIPPLAFVRYINAVPDTFNLTVRWVDQIEFTPMSFVNVPFRGLGQGGYQGLEAGSRHFRVFTYDPALAGNVGGATTAQMADTTFDFVAGQYYTILHRGYSRTGQTPAIAMYILNDALPAANALVSVRAMNMNSKLGAVDLFSTPRDTSTLVGLTPSFANVAFNAITAYTNLAVGQFSSQTAQTGTTFSQSATAAPAGVVGTTAADPIAGYSVGGSVFTEIAFPPAVDGSGAQAYPVSMGSNRIVRRDALGITASGANWVVEDSVIVGAGQPNFRANFCQPTIYRWCKVTVSAAVLNTAPLGTVAPASVTAIVVDNTATTVTTAADLSAFTPIFLRKTYTLTLYNSDVVWISDRQPPRTTAP